MHILNNNNSQNKIKVRKILLQILITLVLTLKSINSKNNNL